MSKLFKDSAGNILMASNAGDISALNVTEIDREDTDYLNKIRALKVSEVKEVGYSKITKKYPPYKQMNITADYSFFISQSKKKSYDDASAYIFALTEFNYEKAKAAVNETQKCPDEVFDFFYMKAYIESIRNRISSIEETINKSTYNECSVIIPEETLL